MINCGLILKVLYDFLKKLHHLPIKLIGFACLISNYVLVDSR